MTLDSQPEPPKPVGVAMQFIIINGDGTSIHYTPQSATDGGTSIIADGPVLAVGPHGSANGGHAIQASRDATIARVEDPPSKKGWWARLRDRGLIVAIATIVAAIAVVIGTAVAICTWIGLAPLADAPLTVHASLSAGSAWRDGWVA